jgi:hypothetical protein
MGLALMLMLLAAGSAPPPVAQQGPGASYKSAKSVDTLEACLTEKLTDVGEVVSLKTEDDTTILLVRDNPEGPMTIELAPGTVTVTSQFITGTRGLVKGCL